MPTVPVALVPFDATPERVAANLARLEEILHLELEI